MKGLNEYLRTKGPQTGNSYNFWLRGQIRISSECIRKNTPRSPGAWATSMLMCGLGLKYLAESRTVETLEMRQRFIEATPRALGSLISEAKDKAVLASRDYRARGIDPQVAVTVMPRIEKVKGWVRLWEERAPSIRATHRPEANAA